MKLVSKIKVAGQRAGAFLFAPSRVQIQYMLFTAGVILLSGGVLDFAHADSNGGIGLGAGTTYSDARIANAAVAILSFLEGSFGALVMVVSGVGAIMSAAFGQYKAALGCLVVAVGSFILRSFLTTFFNTSTLSQDGGGGTI